jgi:hypothetical protein
LFFRLMIWIDECLDTVSRTKVCPSVDIFCLNNLQATCKTAAQKQIHQLLFPRARRKKFKTHEDELGDSSYF